MKILTRISVWGLCLAGSFPALATNPDSTTAPDSVASVLEQRVDSLIGFATTHLGTRYCMGGSGDGCFDCSGFVSLIYSQLGVELPHSSAAIAKMGEAVKREDIKPGDIVYFKGRNTKNKKVGHVGIVVQNDGHTVTFIHASVNRGICFEDTDTDYYRVRYLGARRLIR